MHLSWQGLFPCSDTHSLMSILMYGIWKRKKNKYVKMFKNERSVINFKKKKIKEENFTFAFVFSIKLKSRHATTRIRADCINALMLTIVSSFRALVYFWKVFICNFYFFFFDEKFFLWFFKNKACIFLIKGKILK